MKTLFVLTFVSPTKRSPDDGFTNENEKLIFTNKWMVKIEQDLFFDVYPHSGQVIYRNDIVVFPVFLARYFKKLNIQSEEIWHFFQGYINRYIEKHKQKKLWKINLPHEEPFVDAKTWGAVVYFGVQDEDTWNLLYDFFEMQSDDEHLAYECNIERLPNPVEPFFFWLEKDSSSTEREACILFLPRQQLRTLPLHDNQDYQGSDGARIIYAGEANPNLNPYIIENYTVN